MKKKIFVGMLALSFAVIATLNVFISNQDSTLRLSCITLEGLASESSSSENTDAEALLDDNGIRIGFIIPYRTTPFINFGIGCGKEATTSCNYVFSKWER